MVASGEATPEQIDTAITDGPGLRWPVQGPCLTFHLAGGEGGMAHMLDHFGPSLKEPWTRLDAPELTQRLRDDMVAGCESEAAGRTFADLAAERDQLSGGERQRAATARALVTTPDVLLCDEVTSALDVSVQASIIDLLRSLREELGTAMLFVTHNIALARHIADHIAVLRDGHIVEAGTVKEVLTTAQHSYTRDLLANTPRMTS